MLRAQVMDSARYAGAPGMALAERSSAALAERVAGGGMAAGAPGSTTPTRLDPAHPRDLGLTWVGEGPLAGLLQPAPPLSALPPEFLYVPVEDVWGNLWWLLAGEVDSIGVPQPVIDWGATLDPVVFFQYEGERSNLARWSTFNDGGIDRRACALLEVAAGAMHKRQGFTFSDAEAFACTYVAPSAVGLAGDEVCDDSAIRRKGGIRQYPYRHGVVAPASKERVARVVNVPVALPPFPGFWGGVWYLRCDVSTRIAVIERVSADEVAYGLRGKGYISNKLTQKLEDAKAKQVGDAVAAGFQLVIGVILVAVGQTQGLALVSSGIKSAVDADQAFAGVNESAASIGQAFGVRIVTYQAAWLNLAQRGGYSPAAETPPNTPPAPGAVASQSGGGKLLGAGLAFLALRALLGF